MESQDNGFKGIDPKIESKEGEQIPVYKANEQSSFLDYTFIPNPEKLNKAFDILFEEALKDNQTILWNQKN